MLLTSPTIVCSLIHRKRTRLKSQLNPATLYPSQKKKKKNKEILNETSAASSLPRENKYTEIKYGRR